MANTKKSNRRRLVEKLDNIFSKYIRLKEAAPMTGLVKCISCGRTYDWRDIQNGHYASRANMATRWSETNCHPQCYACNVMRHGNMIEYRHALVKLYGEQGVEQIEAEAHTTRKFAEWELEDMIKYYTALVAMLLKQKKL